MVTLISFIESKKANLLNKIHRFLGAIIIAFSLIGATNALNAVEWQAKKDEKSGGFVGVNYDPLLTIGVFGGYQWYLYDKPHFHFGVRLVANLDYTFMLYLHKINFDVSPHFIWDFFNSDEHTLGWHFAPLGFGLGMTMYSGGVYSDSSIFNPSYYGSAYSVSGFGFGYLFQTGLHYYHNINHQVYLTYRTGNMYGHTFKIGYAYKF